MGGMEIRVWRGVAVVLALGLIWALAELRSRSADIERLRHLPAPAPAPAASAGTAPPAGALETPALRTPEGPTEAESASKPPAPAVPVETVPLLKARITDTSLPAPARLAALRALRFSAPQERDAAVVASMLALLDASAEPEVRAEVCRQLSRVEDPALRFALLFRARQDPAPRVREEALESLGRLARDAEIRAALEHAAEHDADDRVRLQARRSLGPGALLGR
jgi:hypothetical protein